MRDKEENFKIKDDNQVSVVINMLNGMTLVTDDHNGELKESRTHFRPRHPRGPYEKGSLRSSLSPIWPSGSVSIQRSGRNCSGRRKLEGSRRTDHGWTDTRVWISVLACEISRCLYCARNEMKRGSYALGNEAAGDLTSTLWHDSTPSAQHPRVGRFAGLPRPQR